MNVHHPSESTSAGSQDHAWLCVTHLRPLQRRTEEAITQHATLGSGQETCHQSSHSRTNSYQSIDACVYGDGENQMSNKVSKMAKKQNGP